MKPNPVIAFVLFCLIATFSGCAWKRKALIWIKYRGDYHLPSASRNLAKEPRFSVISAQTLNEIIDEDEGNLSMPVYASAGTIPNSKIRSIQAFPATTIPNNHFRVYSNSKQHSISNKSSNNRRTDYYLITEARLSYAAGLLSWASIIISRNKGWHKLPMIFGFTGFIVFGLLAFFLGLMSLSRKDNNRARRKGKILANTGIILGILPTLVAVILTIFILASLAT
jgi:hypothetical protein